MSIQSYLETIDRCTEDLILVIMMHNKSIIAVNLCIHNLLTKKFDISLRILQHY